MALTRSEQALVEALAVLPPNNVYADAGKREILSGFRLFTDRRITDIGWETGAVLVLGLAGDPGSAMSRPATVRVSKEGDLLRFRCSHPDHNGSERCSHVVCALMTLVHFFRPNVLQNGKRGPALPGPARGRPLQANRPAGRRQGCATCAFQGSRGEPARGRKERGGPV